MRAEKTISFVRVLYIKAYVFLVGLERSGLRLWKATEKAKSKEDEEMEFFGDFGGLWEMPAGHQ
jgi:hypothetical protein